MMTQNEIEKRIGNLSELSIIGEYFSGSKCVRLTEKFCAEFGPFTSEERRVATLSHFTSRRTSDVSTNHVGDFYYFSTLKEVFSKLEDKVKRELLAKFVTLLDELTKETKDLLEEVESNKKTEIEHLYREKEKQVSSLEEQIEAIRKLNGPSSAFELLDNKEVAMNDYFLTDKGSQNFELIEDSSSLGLPSTSLVPKTGDKVSYQ